MLVVNTGNDKMAKRCQLEPTDGGNGRILHLIMHPWRRYRLLNLDWFWLIRVACISSWWGLSSSEAIGYLYKSASTKLLLITWLHSNESDNTTACKNLLGCLHEQYCVKGHTNPPWHVQGTPETSFRTGETVGLETLHQTN